MTFHHAHRLMRHMPWLLLLSMVCVSLAVLWAFHREAKVSVRDQAQHSNTWLSQTVVNTVVRPLGDLLHLADEERSRSALLSNPQVSRLGGLIAQALEDLPVQQIRLLDRRGVVVYAKDANWLGQTVSSAVVPTLAAVLQGQVLSHLEFQSHESSIDGGVLHRDVVTTFVPVRLSPQGEVQGVLQLRTDVTDLWAQQRTRMMQRAGVLGIVMAVLFALLSVALHSMQVVLHRSEASRRKHLTRLTDMALRDGLTGAFNRRAWDGFVRRSDRRAPLHGMAIVMIDLDHFKPVNDQHGHAVGDALLKVVTSRLCQCVGSRGRLYRLGGDEFVAVLGEVNPGRVEATAARIVSVVAEPVFAEGLTLRVSVSLGVAMTPERRQANIARLIKQADEALYRAKAQGRSTYIMAPIDAPWCAASQPSSASG